MFLLRHAKSNWDQPGLADFDRPLNKRGRKAALAIGAYMKEKSLNPGLVLSSPSARTRGTLERLEKGLGEAFAVRFVDQLYLASAATILTLIQEAPARAASLMIVAHNPGMYHAALEFIKTAAAADLAALEHNFPTAALVELSFPVETWNEVNFGAGKLVRFILPRRL